jgi:hypothetical protein
MGSRGSKDSMFGVAGSVEGDLAALSESAQEVPRREAARGLNDRVHVQQAVCALRLPEREKLLDSCVRGAVRAERWPLHPVVGEHCPIVSVHAGPNGSPTVGAGRWTPASADIREHWAHASGGRAEAVTGRGESGGGAYSG